MIDEIKPCPFCFVRHHLSVERCEPEDSDHKYLYYVYCYTCRASGSHKVSEWLAVQDWNRASDAGRLSRHVRMEVHGKPLGWIPE